MTLINYLMNFACEVAKLRKFFLCIYIIGILDFLESKFISFFMVGRVATSISTQKV